MSRGRVQIVDDESAVRGALARLLRRAGYEVTEHAAAEPFLDTASAELDGCVLLDLRLPGRDGLEVQTELERRGIRIPVIFLTGHGDVATGVRAMKRGAADFLEKPVSDDDLLSAVAAAVERDRADRGERAGLAALAVRAARLTERERAVWLEVARGSLNKQIAGRLGIAERTVKAHRARAMEKLGVGSAAELALAAQRLGFATGPD